MPSDPPASRRSQVRGPEENRATGLVQSLLNNPEQAASDLERDLEAGADTDLVSAFLDTASGLARSRGIDITGVIERVKWRLRRQGYAI